MKPPYGLCSKERVRAAGDLHGPFTSGAHHAGHWLDRVQQETLTLSYWFEPPSEATKQALVIRLSGHRLGTGARSTARDQFVHDERVESLPPGSGRVCVTSRIQGVNPGEWQVSAAVGDFPGSAGRPRHRRGTGLVVPLHRAAWSSRSWSLSDGDDAPVHTGLAPLARIPGIVPGIWPAMVAAGVAVALVSFALLYGPNGGTGPAVRTVLAALLTGTVTAKAWFALLHRGREPEEGWFIGWCVQGFIAGLLIAVGTAALLRAIPAGIFLDTAAPGVLLGVAIGRLGCFLAGCCGGRPTASRWGVWSSDRRLGIRRIPTQLMEATLAAGLGAAALLFVTPVGTAHGGVFAASLATYTLIRQGILRLRAEPRLSSRGPQLTGAVATAVIVADLVVHATGLLHLPVNA